MPGTHPCTSSIREEHRFEAPLRSTTMDLVFSPMVEPQPKRRKINVDESQSFTTTHHAEIRTDGTMTPVQEPSQNTRPHEVDAMETSVSPSECPCGYLHGPGEHHFHDISAVGLSSSMMRGPD